MEKLFEINPKTDLILSEKLLNLILTEGHQISSTDFDGWIFTSPIAIYKKHMFFINLAENGVVYIVGISPKNKRFNFDYFKKFIYIMKESNILLNLNSNPFPELNTQLNLKMNPESTEFIDEPLFSHTKAIKYKEGLNMKSNMPILKTAKLQREVTIRCPDCNKFVSFNVDDALEIMQNNSIDIVDLKCNWCKSYLTIDKEKIEQSKIIYKSVR